MRCRSARRLEDASTDICHCFTNDLGRTSALVTSPRSCVTYSNWFSFFEDKISFLLSILLFNLFDTAEDEKHSSVMLAVPKLAYSLKQCIAHRFRAFVQFKVTNEIKQSLKSNPNTILIAIDCKHKTLKMKFCEGQVEHYGNKGMSLLGLMEVEWVT